MCVDMCVCVRVCAYACVFVRAAVRVQTNPKEAKMKTVRMSLCVRATKHTPLSLCVLFLPHGGTRWLGAFATLLPESAIISGGKRTAEGTAHAQSQLRVCILERVGFAPFIRLFVRGRMCSVCAKYDINRIIHPTCGSILQIQELSAGRG